jgi:hypothetical protein
MAAYTATFDRTPSYRGVTVAYRGQDLPAALVTCDCASPNCGGTTVLVPVTTIDSLPSKGRKAALHGLVCNRKVLGFPVAPEA